MILPPITTPITAAGYTKVTAPSEDPPGKYTPYGFYTEDGSDWHIATSSSGADTTPILFGSAGVTPALRIRPDDDGAICWAKGTTSTNLITLRGVR